MIHLVALEGAQRRADPGVDGNLLGPQRSQQRQIDQMADGSEIFIYTPTGQCLTARHGGLLRLSHCDLSLSQRWRPLGLGVAP